MTTLVGSIIYVYLQISIISPVFACLISSSVWCLTSLSEEGKAIPSKFYEFRFEIWYIYIYLEMVVFGRLNEDKHFKGI